MGEKRSSLRRCGPDGGGRPDGVEYDLAGCPRENLRAAGGEGEEVLPGYPITGVEAVADGNSGSLSVRSHQLEREDAVGHQPDRE